METPSGFWTTICRMGPPPGIDPRQSSALRTVLSEHMAGGSTLLNDNNRDDATDRALLAKYDGRVPRYTSYPTAAQFSASLGAEAYRGWLRAVRPGQPVSLYVHVPFCKRLCWYCGCNTRVVQRADLISDYVRGLGDELALLAAALGHRPALIQMHLGGGTPNLLSPADLDHLFASVAEAFEIAPGLELSAEGDPASLTREWVQAAAAKGLTRFSLGVQDLNPNVQALVNRTETYEQVAAAVGWLREAGVASINFDLMYGLPGQTARTVTETLRAAVTLRPDRIALFGYAHVPWMKPHQRLIDETRLPDAGQRLAQARAGVLVLQGAGYQRIGLDHFALPTDSLSAAGRGGALKRNFQGYTADPCDTLLAIGASGIGKLPQGYVQNHTTEVAWRAAVRRGELPVARGLVLSDDDRFRAAIIERLMCDLAVDLEAVCTQHGRQLADLDSDLEALAPFIADGVIERRGARLSAPERGRPFLRSVCAVFDAYLDKAQGRHAQAV